MTDQDCLFCGIITGDVPAARVHEDDRTVAFMDIQPATRGHALVVPRAHAADPARDDLELPWTPTPGDPDEIAAAARDLVG